MKPGIQTTELWVTIAHLIVAAAVALGLFKGSDQATLETAISGGLAAAAALISSAMVVMYYIRGRATIKVNQALEASK